MTKVIVIIALLVNLGSISSCKRASSAEPAPALPHIISDTAKKPTSASGAPREGKKDGLLKCPVCSKAKKADEERCSACDDEIANTCYRCDKYEYHLNGKLCSDCRKIICAICNRKKDSRDNDLCAKCHNAIEVGKK